MTHTEWQIRAHYTGPLTDDQAETLAGDGATIVITNDHGPVEIRKPYTVPAGTDPIDVGRTELAAMTHLRRLVGAGALTGPDRVVFETLAAWRADSDLIGPAEAAGILGVTAARLRQLRRDDPMCPRPVLDVGGMQVYARSPMEAFRDARARGSRPAGERRAGDSEILSNGMRFALLHGDLGQALNRRFGATAAMQGPKYIAEKALLLGLLTAEQYDQITAALTGDDLTAFRTAYARAIELEPRIHL